MLVLSREPGKSIHLKSAGETCVITVQKVLPDAHLVTLLIIRANAKRAGKLDARRVDVLQDASVAIRDGVELKLLDFRGDEVRIGIDAPREYAVHTLEVYEAMQAAGGSSDREEDGDQGLAGSRVPRPTSPKPPALAVQLEEPRD